MTAIRLVYSHLRKLLMVSGLLLISGPLASQQWQLLQSVTLEQPVLTIKRDHVNNLYIHDLQGNVVKLDNQGKTLAVFAPSQYGQITTIEPWASFRLFLYYENSQQYIFLDRYLAGGSFARFPSSIGFARIAAPSSDNQIWIVDDRSFSLIKYDFNFDQVTLEIPLSQLPQREQLQPYQLTEFQNRLYMGDARMGILVFDNIGNYLKTISVPAPVPFDFDKEALYFLYQDSIRYLGLYNDIRKEIPLPETTPHRYSHALILGNKIALVYNKQIDFYRYSP